MKLIGILGLLVLLSIAVVLSRHRSSIKPSIIIWGISLQVLFALIVLREDAFSFAGMGVLTALLILFLLQSDYARLGGGIKGALLVLLPCGLLGALLFFIPYSWFIVLTASLVFLAVNDAFKMKDSFRRYATAAFLVSGLMGLVLNDLYGRVILAEVSIRVTQFLSLADYGSRFLFGNLADSNHFFPGQEASWPGFGFQFAFTVLPIIIFFSAFISILYYMGIMQKVIVAMARFMRWTMGTSGAETLSCTANIFVGQTEAPLLIRPFLDGLTKSELSTVMVGGFATIAGSVLGGYIAMGIPAGHLIAASVMAAPGALVVGKIIYPETEKSQTAGDVELPRIKAGENVVEATANGITDGFKLALNVAAMLIGFIALIAFVDIVLNWLDLLIDHRLLNGEYVEYGGGALSPAIGEYRGIFPGSLRTFFGTIFRPLAFVMGVPWVDSQAVGNLMGVKMALNEFVSFGMLGSYIKSGVLSEKAVIISTYALCGFANFSSIGIQIGGISALAPGRRTDLAKVGLKAMFGGTIVSWLTATIAGLLL